VVLHSEDVAGHPELLFITHDHMNVIRLSIRTNLMDCLSFRSSVVEPRGRVVCTVVF